MEPEETIYYGVFIPNEVLVSEEDGRCKNVFIDKVDALKEVKKNKKARFKAFSFYHEAVEFALHGSEFPNNNSTLECNPKPAENPTSVGEKPSQFRGPKTQDLVKLRKAIENGEFSFVQSTIWENPRYLISSGDTPSILHEGARYNALHVAAKCNNAEMCDLILRTVGSPEFLQLLYGEEHRHNCEESSKILLDLYLNTPDKTQNETPLHFAVKFGAAEVVEVLVSYPQCDKNVSNKFGDRPKDIVCNRMTNADHRLVQRIKLLLEDRFYVPVLRSEDNCVQPVIGDPFSPTTPPKLNTNPISPRLEIHAYAGPMKKDEASIFRKKWKTPPRTVGVCLSPVSSNNLPKTALIRTPTKSTNEADYRLQDTEKGLERVGRNLAKKFNVGWKEYWPFLGTFTDLTSKEGLDTLENYLKNRFLTTYAELYTNLINKQMIDSENSSGGISDNSINIIQNSATNITVSPMSELCRNFEACNLSDSPSKDSLRSKNPITISNNLQLHQGTNRSDCVFDYLSKIGMSPCLCVEKSCQVFANRFAHQILYQMDNVTAYTIDSLETEIKHLKSLIGSFMDDPAFTNIIKLQSVHSRIAYLIACKLKQCIFDEELDEKIIILETVIQKYDKMVDVFSSDDEEYNNYNQQIRFVRKKSTADSKQVICLIQNVIKSLECESENELMYANTEEDCIKAWCNAIPCNCVWKTNKSTRKGSLIKKNTSNKFSSKNLRYNQYRNDTVPRRLSFLSDDEDHDKGDCLENVDPLLQTISCNSIIFKNAKQSSSDSSSEYESANSTKNSSDVESEDEDKFEDVETEDVNVFVEGNVPTKMDYAVYNATKVVEMTPTQYPHIYRWRHSVHLIPEDERSSWPSPNTSRYKFSISKHANAMSTPRNDLKKSLFTPLPQSQSSWLRVTGQNSPLKSLRAFKENQVLTYEDF